MLHGFTKITLDWVDFLGMYVYLSSKFPLHKNKEIRE